MPILALAFAVAVLLGLADWGRSEPEPVVPVARFFQGVGAFAQGVGAFVLDLADQGKSDSGVSGYRLCEVITDLEDSPYHGGCWQRFRDRQRRMLGRVSVFAPQEAVYPDGEAQLCADAGHFEGDPSYEICIQEYRDYRDARVRMLNVQIIDCRYRNGRIVMLTPEQCAKFEGTQLY